MPASRRRVALLIETSRSYGRGLLRGIATYAHLRGDWSLHYVERSLEEAPPAWLRNWTGDGILARLETQEMADAVMELDIPLVDLRCRLKLPGVPALDTDPAATAALAVEHFLQSGFRHLAYCGFPGVDFSDARESAFIRQAQWHGMNADAFHPIRNQILSTHTFRRENPLHSKDPALAKWLLNLAKPVAIFACNDARGRQILQQCHRLNLAVPDQVAVLGVDNDPVVCELSEPALSSIEPATGEIGFRGAEILADLMNGNPPPEKPLLFSPSKVVGRRSSDVVATDDPILGSALRYIRDHACNGIQVQDVLAEVGTSRATLERRFADSMDRTPKDHIMQVRLQHVKRLLMETKLPLVSVARNTGFQTESHMSSVFKRLCATTPGQFRRSQSLS